ncbi:hypothetical protein HNP32_001639 [Brevundimonas bullata]|uniref:Uncharacterized protein n=1 Tax=Brevundimonas bullata TaxID=13160 RepID=A0A7W7N311_9CAUL|nr:hypothetical protein [Brevundimonas bullata]MBB4797915.1 hypothetical protein [Brevundimonas bullata]MBB6382874.1 hypothetical protein [Brevundimonas bullata]
MGGVFPAGLMGLAMLASLPEQGPSGSVNNGQATELEDIVVQGRRIDERVRGFIDEVVAAPAGRGPARWRDNICVGVANLRGDAAQYLADRVSEVALDIGLEPGEPGCQPNVLIIGTDDGAGMARGLVAARRSVFWPGGSGMSRSRSALEAFQTNDHAIRWWHISLPVDSQTGALAVRLPGEAPPTVARTTSGRLRTTIRNDLGRVIIILDVTKIDGLDLRQIADYAAMVAFSQVDPDADTQDYDSILSLFGRPQTTPHLTEWDMTYLKALYKAELNQSAANQQAGEIQGLMARAQKRAQETAPEPD